MRYLDTNQFGDVNLGGGCLGAFTVLLIVLLVLLLLIFTHSRLSESIPLKGVVSRVTNDEVLIITEENKGICVSLDSVDMEKKPFIERGSVVKIAHGLGEDYIVDVLVSTTSMDSKEIKVNMKNKYAEILAEIKDPQARILFEDALAKMLNRGEL